MAIMNGVTMINGHAVDANGHIIANKGGMLSEAAGIVQIYQKYNGDVTNKLDKNDIKALMNYYCNEGYGEINGYSTDNQYVEYARRLLQKLATSNVFNRQKFTLYRGERVHHLFDRLGLQYCENTLNKAEKLLKDKQVQYTNKFISVSGKLDRAKAFACEDEFEGQWGHYLIWRLDGSNCIRAYHRTIGNFVDDDEYILPVGTIFRITKVKWVQEYSEWYLYVDAKIINMQWYCT